MQQGSKAARQHDSKTAKQQSSKAAKQEASKAARQQGSKAARQSSAKLCKSNMSIILLIGPTARYRSGKKYADPEIPESSNSLLIQRGSKAKLSKENPLIIFF